MNRPVVIYGLVDPRDGRVRYVGRSVTPEARLCQHLSRVRYNRGVWDWKTSLAADGLKPELLVLAMADESTFPAVERHWIAKLSGEGDLLNRHRGDKDGTPVFRPPRVARTNLDATLLIPSTVTERARWRLAASLAKTRDGEPASFPVWVRRALNEAMEREGKRYVDGKRGKGGGR